MKDPRDIIISPVVSEKSYALIEDNEIGSGAFGDHTTIAQTERIGGRGGTQLHRVGHRHTDFVDEEPEHAIHRGHASGQRAVLEVGSRPVRSD